MQKIASFWFAVGSLLYAAAANAAVSPEEAEKLGVTGTPLTPVGATRAGNADGSIPEWTGGITAPPAGYQSGGAYVDPYADDKPLFTITAQNYEQYIDKLTQASIELFRKYPDQYRMNIYPTRRSASFPEYIYEGTIANATKVQKVHERNLGSYDNPGIPFPIPKDGWDVMANHSHHFWGGTRYTWDSQAIITYPDGKYTVNRAIDHSLLVGYLKPEDRPTDAFFQDAHWCRAREFVSPPRTAGQMWGGCNYKTNIDFDAYIYIQGQRRVRKAPEIGFYDSPSTGSDGMLTSDQYTCFAFTGSEERFDHKLLGIQEKFIPYNSYKMAQKDVTLDDIVGKTVNPDFARYELHRNWVVESTLRDKYRHLLPKRLTYVDEDSWSCGSGVHYDKDGNVWRVTEVFLMNYYDVPTLFWWGDAHYDLVAGRWASTFGWSNGIGNGPKFDIAVETRWFTPQGLRERGIR